MNTKLHNQNYMSYLYSEVDLSGLEIEGKAMTQKTKAEIVLTFNRVIMHSHFRLGVNDTIMCYNGHKYTEIKMECLKCIISQVLKRNGIEPKVRMINEIYSFCVLHLGVKKYKPKKSIVVFKNGVLDLDTMILHPHNEIFETNIYIDINYSPNEKSDRFSHFLDMVLPASEYHNVLQEFFGSMFIENRERPHRRLCLLGGGEKYLIEGLIKAMLGNNCFTEFTLDKLIGCESKMRTIAEVHNKLVNFSHSETPIYLTEDPFNFFAQGWVMAHYDYRKPFKAERTPVLIEVVNRLSTQKDDLDYKRIKIDLKSKLTEDQLKSELEYMLEFELCGIINWIMKGRKRYVERILSPLWN